MRTAIACVLLSATILPSSQPRAPKLNLLRPETVAQKAPPLFRARIENTRATFEIEVHRDWAPNGADRFYSLVKAGFYDNCSFFRVLPYFMAQFGINGDPKISNVWRTRAAVSVTSSCDSA